MINEESIQKFRSVCDNIFTQIRRDVIGQDEVVEGTVIAMIAGGNVLLEGVPGVGKTRLVRSLGRVFDLPFSRIQFTPDLMPADVTGTNIIVKDENGNSSFQFQPGPVFSNIVLADEINRATPKTQSALLEVMEEGHVTVDGRAHDVPQPFTVIATQNPVGSAGTQLLPQAQLDRFMIRLHLGYPEFADEMNLLKDRHTANPLDSVRQVADKEALLKMQKEAVAVHMADSLYEYVTRLSRATREHAMITLGLSSRGALAVCRMAKAHAYMEGRDYAVPEDVAAIFADVSGHRVILSPKAKMTETSASSVIESVLASVPMPAAGRGE